MDLVLIVLQVIVSMLLIGVILLQKTSTDSVASIGGGNLNAFAKSSSGHSPLAKVTMWLAAIFMLNSLLLSVVIDKKNNSPIISHSLEHKKDQNSKEHKNK
jgi:preprotein translocase subunit SecG